MSRHDEPDEPKEPKAQTPSVGRIVHFVTAAMTLLPAIITQVKSDTEVNLHVFQDADGKINPSTFMVGATYSTKVTPGCWMWPKKV